MRPAAMWQKRVGGWRLAWPTSKCVLSRMCFLQAMSNLCHLDYSRSLFAELSTGSSGNRLTFFRLSCRCLAVVAAGTLGRCHSFLGILRLCWTGFPSTTFHDSQGRVVLRGGRSRATTTATTLMAAIMQGR